MSNNPTTNDPDYNGSDTDWDNTSIFDKRRWIDSHKAIMLRCKCTKQPRDWKIFLTKKGEDVDALVTCREGIELWVTLKVNGRILLLQDLCILRVVREIKKNPEKYEPFGKMMGTIFSKMPKILEILPSELKERIEDQLKSIPFCYHCDKVNPKCYETCESCGHRFCTTKLCSYFFNIVFGICEQCEDGSTWGDESHKRSLERHFIEDCI